LVAQVREALGGTEMSQVAVPLEEGLEAPLMALAVVVAVAEVSRMAPAELVVQATTAVVAVVAVVPIAPLATCRAELVALVALDIFSSSQCKEINQ
jgi:predicted branched-subunit amino acid permease